MKKNKTAMVNGVEVEIQEGSLPEDDGNDQEPELGEDSEGEEGQDEVGGTESIEEEEEEALDLDWKAARLALKKSDAETSWSIDDFEQRKVINDIKQRFNNKERTLSLFLAIERLGEV